jgi:hypothetical protein
MLDDPVPIAHHQIAAGRAEVLRSILEAAGIPAFTAIFNMGEAFGSVRVFVSACDRERGAAIIEEAEAARHDREEFQESGFSMVRGLACDSPMAAGRCRKCGWSWQDGAEEAEGRTDP